MTAPNVKRAVDARFVRGLRTAATMLRWHEKHECDLRN